MMAHVLSMNQFIIKTEWQKMITGHNIVIIITSLFPVEYPAYGVPAPISAPVSTSLYQHPQVPSHPQAASWIDTLISMVVG